MRRRIKVQLEVEIKKLRRLVSRLFKILHINSPDQPKLQPAVGSPVIGPRPSLVDPYA
jgi:hypothetical protein